MVCEPARELEYYGVTFVVNLVGQVDLWCLHSGLVRLRRNLFQPRHDLRERISPPELILAPFTTGQVSMLSSVDSEVWSCPWLRSLLLLL